MSEQITTAEELDALPVGSVLGYEGGAAMYSIGGVWRASDGRVFAAARFLAAAKGSLVILFRPDAPAPSDETHRALTWDDLKPYEREQGGYWLYWRGATHGSNDNKTFIRVSRPAPSDEDREALDRVRTFIDSWAGVVRAYGDPARIALRPGDAVLTLSDLRTVVDGMPTFSTPTDGAEKCGIPEVRTALSVSAEQAEVAACGWKFPLPGWAGEDQMDPCTCDLPAGHLPTDDGTKHSCAHIRGEVTP